jgi:hypothetical protein
MVDDLSVVVDESSGGIKEEKLEDGKKKKN